MNYVYKEHIFLAKGYEIYKNWFLRILPLVRACLCIRPVEIVLNNINLCVKKYRNL